MRNNTTSTAAINARAVPNEDSEQTLLERLENHYSANERHGVLLEAIDDNLMFLMGMEDGESRNRELEKCWLLFWAARDLRDRLHRELGGIVDGFCAERREGAAA